MGTCVILSSILLAVHGLCESDVDVESEKKTEKRIT